MAEIGDARLPERFWGKIDHSDTSDCWQWSVLYKHYQGYGRFWLDGREWRAHRISYMRLVGPIPEGLHIDHLCRNRACVNPEHLEPVTEKENILRGVGWGATNARMTHCLRGHPFSGDNVYIRPRGGRDCRACKRISYAKSSARKKAEQLTAKKEDPGA